MSQGSDKASEPATDSTVQVCPGEPAAPDTVSKDTIQPQNSHHSPSLYTPELLTECKAIVLYVARHGDVLKEDDKLEAAYKQLALLVSKCNHDSASSDDWQSLLVAYANVTRITFATRGVNGRSVLDTWDELGDGPRVGSRIRRLLVPSFHSKRLQPLLWAATFSVLAIVFQGLTGWTGRNDPAQLTNGWLILHNVVTDLDELLGPAIWGGIGSSVFLMKRISDKLFEFAYEKTRLQGGGTRIFLGAILGVSVVQLFFSENGQAVNFSEISLSPLTAAFVAGLAVKPIYATFETLVEIIRVRLFFVGGSGEGPWGSASGTIRAT